MSEAAANGKGVGNGNDSNSESGDRNVWIAEKQRRQMLTKQCTRMDLGRGLVFLDILAISSLLQIRVLVLELLIGVSDRFMSHSCSCSI